MIDILRQLIDPSVPREEQQRELEVIRARVAGGEPVERVAEDYGVRVEAIVAACRLPGLAPL